MKINIYYCNNGVGVVNHAILVKTILYNHDVILYDISIASNGKMRDDEYRNGDLGIFIQNIRPERFANNKKNVYIVCEEWLTQFEIENINRFDYILTHSNYAKELLNQFHKNVYNTGFFSLDRYFFPINNNKILHFKGKSIQKNHELVSRYKSNYDINVIDSEEKYLTDNEVIYQLNNHDIHICCSLYESWGHYLWEAMSCGKLVICSEIPVFTEYLDQSLVKFIPTEKIIKFDTNVRFLKDTIYPLRQGYYVNITKFEELLNNKEELFEFQKNNSNHIRNHYLNITQKNKRKFMETIKFIL